MDFLPLYLVIVLGLLLLTERSLEAPAVCRTCSGHCKGNDVLNVTDTELLDAIVDNETVRILNVTTTSGESLENGKGNVTTTTETRMKRESYIEKRTCSSRFQLELFMIPVSIAAIPFAIVSLLLCVCFCGPKEQRGRAPEKIMGVRLSQKRKNTEFDNVSMKSGVQKTMKLGEDEELEYKDGYIQRKDSKKTRFSTDVLFIEPPMRRASSVSCLEGLNSRSGSFAVPQPGEKPPLDDLSRKLSRHISFSDSVSVLGEEAETIGPLPPMTPSDKRKSIFKRSISVN